MANRDDVQVRLEAVEGRDLPLVIAGVAPCPIAADRADQKDRPVDLRSRLVVALAMLAEDLRRKEDMWRERVKETLNCEEGRRRSKEWSPTANGKHVHPTSNQIPVRFRVN